MALGMLPPSSLLNYQLTGMDKGFTYYANGELRWQHNPQAYALTLSVKAFLIGSRHWRSQGLIGEGGLSPLKFSDSWRGERASHFDREQQRIVFSSNAPVAALQPGAQDQISLYMQLAAAMAGDPQRYPPGTRLQVQTATLRDAVPWLLILEGEEPVTVSGQTVTASKWVCQPRSQYDAKVEIWLSPHHAWMPARIRITLTPPLTMVAQDADAAGISLAALLSADVHRGRYLALNAWRALDISHGDREALRHAVEGIEGLDIVSGLDDLPSPERIYAETHDAGEPEVARAWLDAMPGPLAVWGLMIAARRL